MTLHFTAVAASQHALDVLRDHHGRGGEVHSAYRRTINIRFAGDQLVCLHGGRRLVAPFGIALGQRFRSPAFERITPGAPVEAAPHFLRIPTEDLEVELAETPAWAPRARATTLAPDAAARHAETLEAILLQHDNPDGLAGLVEGADATPLLRRALPGAQDLERGLARGDRARILTGAGPLLGLGPGLTPAGDDFLAGFLGTAALTRPADEVLIRDVGAEILRLAESRTTLLSRAFLSHALQGALAPPVDAVAAAILEGAGRPAVARAAQAAAAIGHTSGLDILAGMVFALRANGQRIL
jgi:uncharacterized protein DUF2877